MNIPLYEKIYTYILEKIQDGDLNKGNRVPSEKELAEKFNVSRITSKKALDILAEKKVIERIRGKGSFVTTVPPVPDELNHNLKDVFIPTSEEDEMRLVGLVLPDFSEYFGLNFVKTVEKVCSKLNIHLLIKRTYGLIEEEEKTITSMLQLGVDGLIMIPVNGEHYNNALLKIVLNDFPFVLADRFLKGIPASSVSTDNTLASQQLTDYLISLGHEKIAIISPPPEGISAIEERINGFHIAFSRQGLKLNPDYMLTNLMSSLPLNVHSEQLKQIKEEDLDKIKRFILQHPELTAFVVCEYDLVLLLSVILKELGKKIPEDYSVVCFDNPYTNLEPKFTYIKQNEEIMAEKAVDLLLAKLNGESVPQHIYIKFDLVKGASTSSIQYK
ncbi:DNA-binding transcriptional regulator, LacI/PurR family [Bacillus sp. OV166]|uniref:GntR family transcriptional regulator n=1 Tax=Bacillus sp. OV166 TaxID=1882763 RepID=UPI000A2ADBEF|nr:GntR family transcriptional regulator [Bacillus sp. OV166]SMQ84642.1 DNA-binding transcriptional regulator, LacI/PurR family [Bacillus sp. OV166]